MSLSDQPRTIQTTARVWLANSKKQLRFEVHRKPDGRCEVHVSLWAREGNSWHRRPGGVLSGWPKPLATLSALCRSWFALLHRGLRKPPEVGAS
jgi:hypothetical protein